MFAQNADSKTNNSIWELYMYLYDDTYVHAHARLWKYSDERSSRFKHLRPSISVF